MKCLSVKQPWASLIFHGKDIENRTWHTKYRGEVLIHVSAKSAGIPSELLNEEQFDYFNINPESGIWLQELMAGKYITSAIIGKVDIVDCVTNHPSVWAEKGFAYASMDLYATYPKFMRACLVNIGPSGVLEYAIILRASHDHISPYLGMAICIDLLLHLSINSLLHRLFDPSVSILLTASLM